MDSRWLPVPWAPSYRVSADGHVIGPAGRVLRPAPTPDGYLFVCLSRGRQGKRREYVHRLVYEAWVTRIPPRTDVHHVDGDPWNNSLGNLELRRHAEHVGAHNATRHE